MNYLKISDFDKKTLTSVSKMDTSPRILIPDYIHLPNNSLIHYIADSDQLLGIESSFSLLRNVSNDAFIFHVKELKKTLGNVSPTKVDFNECVRRYQKTHLGIKLLSNLENSLIHNSSPIVLNYSILPSLNKYITNNLVVYQEWFNIRATMWEMIGKIGNKREHFIPFKLPDILPSRSNLNKYVNEFKTTGSIEFYSNETFNILELWRLIHPTADSPIMNISEDGVEHTHLVFIDGAALAIIKLDELLEAAQENPENTSDKLYHFLDNFYSLRSPIGSKEIKDNTDEHVEHSPNEKIIQLIKEQGEAGRLSAAEQKGLIKLSQKYKTIQDPKGTGKTLDQVKMTPEDLKLTGYAIMKDSKHITDKSMLSSTLKEMDEKYIKDGLHKDIVESLLMLQNAGIIVKDLNIKQKREVGTKLDTYIANVQPINGPSSPLHLTIPTLNTDGTFMYRGVKYRLDRQKGEMPIVKTDIDKVLLTSYYGKLYVSRNDSSAHNYSKWIVKHIVSIAEDKDDDTITGLIYGSFKDEKLVLPRAYTAVCSNIDSFLITNRMSKEDKYPLKYKMLFNYSRLAVNFTEAEINKFNETGLTPCGRAEPSGFPLGMDASGIIYVQWEPNIRSSKAGQLEELGPLPFIIDSFLGAGPTEYSEIEIYGKKIPLILVLSYIDGLETILNELKIPFKLSPTNIRLPFNPNEYKLKFKDIVYLIDVTNLYHKILIGGFEIVKKDLVKFKGSDLNRPSIYSQLLSSLSMTNYYLKEIRLLWDMFVEPITKGLLTEMGEPTTFKYLLIRASDLLINDNINNGKTARFKGYERMCGMMYKELVSAVRTHRAQSAMSNVEITINPNAVLLNILQDQSIALVEESNPIQNLKEHESFTHAGSGGRSAVTMMKEDRGFGEHDLGVVSEASPDSAKVGIRAYLTANPNFNSVRGTVNDFNEKTDGPANVLSTTAIISPCITHDDAKRVSFVNVQHGHGVACNGYSALPYRTGGEETIAPRVDELFAVTAEQNGVVKKVDEKILTITYTKEEKDKKINYDKSYELGIIHGTVSGTTIPHNKITDLKVGQKVEKDSVIIFNSGFFERSIMDSNNAVYKHGVIARIAFKEDSDTIEDGCVITEELSNKLITPVSMLRDIIINFNMNVHNLVKVGDTVDPETILCTLETQLGDNMDMRDAEAIKELHLLTIDNPKAKVYGKVTNIEVVYFGNVEDMTFSLQKLAAKFNAVRSKRVDTYGLDEAKTGKITDSIRVNSKKVIKNEFVIKVYIDGELNAGAGDKLVFGNALKTTISRVDTNGITTEDGQPVQGIFGDKSIAARQVGSPDRTGIVSNVIVELSYLVAKTYFGIK